MDNLTIQNHLRSISGLGSLQPEIEPIAAPRLAGAQETGETSFGDMLAESINKVNTMMNDSDQAIDDLATGKSTNIHHTMIALQKADISFKMLLEVRNKVLSAYQDVMKMQA